MRTSRKSPKSFPATRLRALEFRVFRRLGKYVHEGDRVLIACSGGLDSMALLAVLARVLPKLKAEAVVAHIHHGASPQAAVNTARAHALIRVRSMATRLKLSFVSARRKPREPSLHSEAELRAFRHESLRRLAEAHGCKWIALAHHADDLFETRLIRLLRGTGAQGLRAMSENSAPLLRPFLEEPRVALRKYAEETGLRWHEDPTNQDSEPLRNWLRAEWLPALEGKRPGATRAFARSLDLLTQSLAEPEALPRAEDLPQDEAEIAVDRFTGFALHERRRWLAAAALRLRARDFSANQIEEIRKRLEARRRPRPFQMLEIEWSINAERIRARARIDELP